MDSGNSLSLSAGNKIILNPGFTASTGSSVDATINSSLVGKSTDGVSSLTGSNPWQVTVMSYDDEGRVSDKWIWTGNQRAWDTHITYAYNRQGDLTRRGVAVDGQTLYQFYDYNQLGELTAVYINTTTTKPGTAEVTYTYKPDGNVAGVNYRGGKGETYAYNIRDWVTGINNVNNTSSFGASYSYKKNGDISEAEYINPMLPGGGSSQYHYAYTYDNLDRLTSATFGLGSSGSNSDFELSGIEYDNSGNLQYLQRRDQNGNLIDNLTYDYVSGTDKISDIYDAVSSGLNWDAQSASYGYDANGNLTSRSDKLSKISYDWRNLPVDFDLTNGQEIVDNYNAGGQRILKELKGGDWSFYVKDGNKTLAVINQDTVNHFNLFGNSLFGRYEPSNGARRYYLKDNLGSTRMVTDNNGNILQTFDYYPFGLLMPGRSGGSGSTMEKFTGKELDSEADLDLDYFGARYYDAAIGRFLSTDPLAVAYNSYTPYNYAVNNPILNVDFNGMAYLTTAGHSFDVGSPVSDTTYVLPAITVTATREISNMGLRFIASWEKYRKYPYNDQANNATIGFGHLLHPGPVSPSKDEYWITVGMSKQEAFDYLRKDAKNAEEAVRNYVTVKLKQNQFDALVSFVFNERPVALKMSTLLNVINSGNGSPTEIKKAFMMWNKYHNKSGELEVSNGLTNRRISEALMYITGVYKFHN